jgi:5-methylcytosine-specific restriction enzyme A
MRKPIPETISSEHILLALKNIDENGVPPEHRSDKYDLIFDGKTYPPKYVIRNAHFFVDGTYFDTILFSGGKQANTFLEKRGFLVFEKVNSRKQNTWIFQANPERYDLIGSLKTKWKEGTWTVTRYAHDILPGDIGLLWKSGDNSGFYGYFQIVSTPKHIPIDESDLTFFANKEDSIITELRVKFKNFVQIKPLFKSEIIEVEGLQNLSIINQPRGTNFIVTDEEWTILSRLITEKNLKPIFKNPLKPGETIQNKELQEIFDVGPEGGMRRSLKNNCLLLISDPTKGIYQDRWINNVLHYTGMGRTGDQSITFQQNKTLAESEKNKVHLYLFEVFEEGKYTYIGEVEPVGDPYPDDQLDINKNNRKVIIFPIRLRENKKPLPINLGSLIKSEEDSQRKIRKKSLSEIKERAKLAKKIPGTREVISTYYCRDTSVTEYAKLRANGICQLCDKNAPFISPYGEPYLETHHIIWIAKGGEDSIENTVGLCPNCHKKMHILNLKDDIKKLQYKIG